MSNSVELSRIQQLWILLAVVVVCTPIWYWLPLWVPALACAGLAWRAWLLWQGKSSPNRLVMALVAMGLAMGVIWHYQPPLGVEAHECHSVGLCSAEVSRNATSGRGAHVAAVMLFPRWCATYIQPGYPRLFAVSGFHRGNTRRPLQPGSRQRGPIRYSSLPRRIALADGSAGDDFATAYPADFCAGAPASLLHAGARRG